MVDSLRGEIRHVARYLARRFIYGVPSEAECCPACGSRALYDLDVLRFRRAVNAKRIGFISGCHECGLVFSNPQPMAEELMSFYSSSGEWRSSREAEADDSPAPLEKKRGRSWSRMFDPIRHE